MDFLGAPIGYIMNLIYSVLSNYGLTIVVISILFKLIILPLTIKQQKSMVAMQEIQPLIADIQKKYENDKEKQSKEMMKIYQDYNISPFASCLPTLLQFPILIGLYGAIARPLKFILGLSTEKIAQLAEVAGVKIAGLSPYSYEIEIANKISQPELIDKIQDILPGFSGFDFNFFGLDLSVIPGNEGFVILAWILPVLAAALTWLSSYFMQAQNKTSSEAQQTSKVMTMLMPLMILMFGARVPAGLSLYWCINSVLQIVQFFTLDKVIKDRLAGEIAVKGATVANKKIR
ncbi:MAG: YidC/Oxa1 family membrane protein insertase [Clostridia bacterium]|nr:YidC/Oxa1 family membrane protein insertase [Clostridia bacterium]